MTVKKCMKRSVVSVLNTALIRDAAALFVKHHIGMLPVVDEDGRPVGVLTLHDLLTLELPDFVRFVADVDFVHDFGAVETTRPSPRALSKGVASLMKPATTVPEDGGLLRAYALMMQHSLHDILVVSSTGQLSGIASRVDIGAAILRSWKKSDKQ
jgi:CBS-domain-containing membrane protein